MNHRRNLPTTSTDVEIFCPPGSITDAKTLAFPGFKALRRAVTKFVSS